ncbi:MAG: hypothetical protein CND43_03545 [Flavobacteriales bacterium MED-G15]|nr:MAG: hypothetical protein CND43_03545 [Flavobacteriales bacterium MED-G15]
MLKENQNRQALIAYDREKLLYPKERIARFAVMRFVKNYRLAEIIEKPDHTKIAEYTDNDNKVRISMNIFLFDGEIFFDYLENCPIHPVRNEKELPTAMTNMMADGHKIFGIPVGDHVPDLTSKEDIAKLEKYLNAN